MNNKVMVNALMVITGLACILFGSDMGNVATVNASPAHYVTLHIHKHDISCPPTYVTQAYVDYFNPDVQGMDAVDTTYGKVSGSQAVVGDNTTLASFRDYRSSPVKINLGVSGMTSSYLAAHIGAMLSAYPTIEIWSIDVGVLDAESQTPTRTFGANMAGIARTVLAHHGIPIFALVDTNPYRNLEKWDALAYNTQIANVARAYYLPMGPDFYSYSTCAAVYGPGFFADDGVNVTREGEIGKIFLWMQTDFFVCFPLPNGCPV